MKVLFAVSNDEISEAIVKRYQKDYKEIISYKNVYYFNAILKEIQKDKTYDRIVISEELEAFTNAQYDQIDKFIFEKLDSISDEAANSRGDNTPIILICSDRRTKGEEMLVKLFGIGIYDALLGNDRSVGEVCKLIYKSRSKKEAKIYYKVDSDEVKYQSENENDVSEQEIQNILAHYKRLGKNEDKYVTSFDNIVAQYNDAQLRIISKFLPLNVRAVLEEKSPKYQQIMSFNNAVTNNIRKTTKKEEDLGPSGKLLRPQNSNSSFTGPIVIPSSVDSTNVKKLARKQVEPVNKVDQDLEDLFTSMEEPKSQENRSTEIFNNDVEEVIPKTPKRRGRPRKNPLPEEPVNNDTILPGFETETQSDDMILPGFENEENDSILPGFNTEPQYKEAVLPEFDKEEKEENILPGFDEEEKEDNILPGFDKEEKEDNILPGFEEVEEEETPEPVQQNRTYNKSNNNNNNNNVLPGFENINSNKEKPILPGFEYVHNPNNNYKNPFDFDNNEFEDDESETEESETIEQFKQPEPINPVSQIANNTYNQVQPNDLLNYITDDKKIAAFVGTSKNGTSFIINNLAEYASSIGINVAILDTTLNKNSYYIYTKNEEELRKLAENCLENLVSGQANGIQVNRNLTVYTSLPEDRDNLNNSTQLLETIVRKHDLVLLDCDYDTPIDYFANAQDIYLVQSLDILTIQPLTGFLRELKSKDVLDESKIKIILNKYVRVRGISEKTIIGGMSKYNDPAMSFMTDLFDVNSVDYRIIPFEQDIYTRYLESVINCDVSIKGYSKQFMQVLKDLTNWVYSRQSGRNNYKKQQNQTYNNTFSSDISNTLNQMRNNY